MKPTTRIAFVIDKSFSMDDIKGAAITNYNEQIQQAQINSESQNILCSLVTFNADVFEHYWDQPADTIPILTDKTYIPCGGTALRDAIGYVLTKQAKTQCDEGDAFLVVVISDGLERDSKVFSADQLRSLISEKQATGKWTISYMGCDESYLRVLSRETGIPIANMAAFNVHDTAIAKRGLTRGTERMNAYYEMRTSGSTNCVNMYSVDSNNSADFSK